MENGKGGRFLNIENLLNR